MNIKYAIKFGSEYYTYVNRGDLTSKLDKAFLFTHRRDALYTMMLHHLKPPISKIIRVKEIREELI